MLIELTLACGLVAAIALPHGLALHRVTPLLAGTIWLLALALRALVSVGGAVFVFLYLPQTRLFDVVSSWCLHQVLPLLATHLGLSGHPLLHAAVILPALVLAASLLWAIVGLGRGWLTLRAQLRRSPGTGPWGTTLVRDDRIVVAATALGRRRIVLSPAALGAMDGDELQAGMAHELGHLRRCHRSLSLVGSFLVAVARPLPGTRRAEGELAFHLERDADEYAVRHTRDPLALASAICKAAQSHLPEALALGGRGPVGRRLEILLDGAGERSRLAERAAWLTTTLLATLVLGLATSLPAWALTPPERTPQFAPSGADCPH